ncbi:hypothetical protein Tco_0178156 [Tanacetum coccineum]
MEDDSDEPLIIEAVMEGYFVRRVYMDQGASMEVMFEHCSKNLSPAIRSQLRSTQMDLVSFAGGVVKPLGKIELEVIFGDGGLFRTVMINFTMVWVPSPYNVIFGRTGLRSVRPVSSKIHSMVKFPTPRGILTLVTRAMIIFEYQRLEKKQIIEKEVNRNVHREEEVLERVDLIKQTLVNPSYPDQLVMRGGNLSYDGNTKKNHRTLPQCQPFGRACCTKKKSVGIRQNPGGNQRSGRMNERRNSSPGEIPYMDIKRVLVKKSEGSWRMCIEFKNLNLACQKDYYPLSDIDGKIESVVGFQYKCFLDAYNGYHQVQMAQDDKEKTTFYTDQGTYCYTKMPFGLKNAGATYQSNDEKVLISDISETFDNLRRINMKLNPKKYSFGVEDGNFLGYMVTSKGIRANPKKTKCEKGVPRNKEGHSRTTVANHPGKGRNVIRIRGSGDGGRKHGTANREKGKTMSDTLHQPLKQILNKAQASGKLAKYSVELGSYHITYKPRNAIKAKVKNKDVVEKWTLFTDGASNNKGSGAGLVLISPSGVEFTYALRLNFTSMNNEAE